MSHLPLRLPASRYCFRLEIERSKAVEGYNDLRARVTKLEKDAKRAEDERAAAVADANDLRARYTNANDRRNALEKENKVQRTEMIRCYLVLRH